MYNSTLGNEKVSFVFLLARGKGTSAQRKARKSLTVLDPLTLCIQVSRYLNSYSLSVELGFKHSNRSRNSGFHKQFFFSDSGIRITWHRANHTDSWLKLHMRSHIPSPHIRCSTRVPTNFPFRQVHKKLQFTKNVANTWGREWSTKNFVRCRDKSWLCSYHKKRP